MNILRSKLEAGHLVISARTMFYGNFDEYVEGFLSDFYKCFSDRFGIKLKELVKLSKNVTVSLEAGLNLGLVSLRANGTHKLNLKKSTSSDFLLAENSSLNKKLATIFPQRVVVIIDDIDRLKPDELVTSLRLVEVLRQLENVFVIAVGDTRRMGDILSSANVPRPYEYARKVFDHRIHLGRNLRDLERISLLMVEDLLNRKGSPRSSLTESEKGVISEAFHFLILRQIIQNIRDLAKEQIDGSNVGPTLGELWDLLESAGHERLGSIYKDLRGFFGTLDSPTAPGQGRNTHKIWTVSGEQIIPADNTRDGMALLTSRPNWTPRPWEVDSIFRGILPAAYWAQSIVPSPDEAGKVAKYKFDEGTSDIRGMFSRLDQNEKLPVSMLGDQSPESRWSIVKKFMKDPGRDDVERDRSLPQFKDLRLLRGFASAVAERLPGLLALDEVKDEEKRLQQFVECAESFEALIRVERGDL